MKIRRNTAVFEAPRRRRRLPIIRIILAVLLVTLLAVIWQRGGERPQARVEKAISADKLGQ